ncbi:MAG: WG repeat-containing protein [Clostridia bacterium]|nr:WG repeat-containing protein [Clostridia bacterium]
MGRRRKGRRYDNEPKLNIKKVIAVILVLAVIIMFVVAIKKLLNTTDKEYTKNTAASYFSVFTNNKWGVINSLGKTVIEPIYDEMLVVPNNKKAVFIAIDTVDYETKTYKTIVLDQNNKTIFTEYELVEAVDNYDENGNLWYEENVLRVKQDGKYGLIDYEGKVLISCEYDEIYSLKGTKNSIILKKEGKLGLADCRGNIIIEPVYINIMPMSNDYKSGYIVVNSENTYGVVDFNKTVILEPKYQDIKQISANNMYVVKEEGNYKIIDKSANVINDKLNGEIIQINGENIVISKDGKYGVINKNGEERLASNYDYLEYTFDNYYIAKKDNKYGIINIAGEEMIGFSYDGIIYRKDVDFFEGDTGDIETDIISREFKVVLKGIITDVNSENGYFRIRINDEYKYYNLKFEEKNSTDILKSNTLFLIKQDGKYGYADKKGNIIVECKYDDATEQNEFGYAAVKLNGLWGAIDYEGKTVQEPKYELINNLLIKFIDKWHLGEDLNMNYYTDEN